MKKIIFIQAKWLLLIVFLFQIGSIHAQREVERLDRGLVAVKTNNGVFLSWRLFGTDPKDVSFNIYRNGTKVNSSPITGATNMTDAAGTTSSTYTVRTILGGTEQADGATSTVWASQVKTLNLSNRPSNNHTPNDISIGDLDGDGQYELIVKWYPNNAQDNSFSGFTDNTFLAAYKLDGTFLWIIDLGRNIRSGAHYVQVLVGDYDSDGFAEVACKTAPGTRDGKGNYLSKGPAANDDDTEDYRNDKGYILKGPEYLTIFNGKTGEEMATVNYNLPRGNVKSWGDDYGNRVDRFNATNAYLDGVKPSMVFQRGYYARMTMAAYDWDGKTLSNRWTFDSNDAASSRARGQGNHSIMAADIDNDGFDELLTGSACIDHDGKFKWATGHGHGDANHVGDFDINSPGLEVWQVSENKGREPDHYMIRASDGHVLWGAGSGTDNGRGLVADIDAQRPGHEAWSSSVSGLYTASGTRISSSKPSSTNFRMYWDGDLQDELLNGNKIDKWNGNGTSRVLTLTGQSCNGTKATPNISADLFGDWREEVILHDGGSKLYIHTTTIPTQHKLYTLMHDPVYRNAISWQQSSYNQPPHLGFNLAASFANNKVPTPNIVMLGGVDCNGVNGGKAFIDDCNTCVGGNTGKTACVVDCNGDKNGTATLDNCGVCSGGNSVYKPCVESLEAEQACDLDGTIDNDNQGFSGTGFVNTTNTLGAFASWVLYSETSQVATITFRYANGGTTSRDGAIKINGVAAGNLIFPSTGSWTTWGQTSVNLTLTQELNEVVVSATTNDGLANIDVLSFSAGVSDAICLVTSSNENILVNSGVYPNPTQNKVQWNVQQQWSLLSIYGAKLMSGEGNEADLSTLPTGIYILNLGTTSHGIIKQ